MAIITFAQLRLRIFDVLKSKLNDELGSIYQYNIVNYPEKFIPELMAETKEQTIKFLHDIMKIHNESDLNNFYKSTDPKIICCFYLRYWVLINNIEPLSHSDNNKISVPDDNENMLKTLLFEFIEDQNSHQ